MLKNRNVPDGVTNIGEEAFCECSNLINLTIQGSVTRIGRSAFEDCSSLEIINYEGTKAHWEAIDKHEFGCESSLKTIHCSDGDITL